MQSLPRICIKKIIILALFIIAVSVFSQSDKCVATPSAQDFLTKEEREWLADHQKIRLGVGVSFPPYQWVEQAGDNYTFKGIVSDYVNILEHRLNVKMEVVFGLDFNQALELGKKKEIDLFPCLAKTPERSKFLLFTDSYISYPSVIITRDDAPFVGNINDLRGKKVSLVKKQFIYSIINQNYNHLDLKIIESGNAAEELQAVSLGKADACLMDVGVASYFIQKLRIVNLKIAAPSELDKIELSMGVRDDWPILQSIIQKALKTIQNEERDSINQRWIKIKYELGVAKRTILMWAVFVLSIVAMIIFIFYMWNKGLKKEILARKKIENERNAVIVQLQKTLQEVKTLRGFLPICANCRKIRQDSGYWQQIEIYVQEHTDAKFTHGLCPDCLHNLYPGLADNILKKIESKREDSQVPTVNKINI